MFSFFKKKKSVKNNPEKKEIKQAYKSAPGTEIRFNPRLVNKLEADHQELLEIFGEINTAFSASMFT